MKPNPQKNKRVTRQRQGFSLLEMLAAAALVTGTLVPGLVVIRDAMAQSRDLHRRQLLANYAVLILEDQLSHGAKNWETSKTTDYSNDGHDNIRYTLTKSDATADGGIPDLLMYLSVTVYDDANANSTLDSGELQETYRTKVAKLASYENEPQ